MDAVTSRADPTNITARDLNPILTRCKITSMMLYGHPFA